MIDYVLYGKKDSRNQYDCTYNLPEYLHVTYLHYLKKYIGICVRKL